MKSILSTASVCIVEKVQLKALNLPVPIHDLLQSTIDKKAVLSFDPPASIECCSL